MCEISAPALKLGPAPTSTTARTRASSPSSCSACVSASTISGSNALCTSGRLSITVALPSSSIRVRTLSVIQTSLPYSSHPEYAEPGRFHGRTRSRGEAERKGRTRGQRVDDAVVPQACRSIVRARLSFILLEKRRLVCGFVFRGPRPVVFLELFPFNLRQHVGSLLTAHDRNASVRPCPEEARTESTPAHTVISSAEAAADDNCELRD